MISRSWLASVITTTVVLCSGAALAAPYPVEIYVNADGTAAGIGTASDQAWVWEPANEFAASAVFTSSLLVFVNKNSSSTRPNWKVGWL